MSRKKKLIIVRQYGDDARVDIATRPRPQHAALADDIQAVQNANRFRYENPE